MAQHKYRVFIRHGNGRTTDHLETDNLAEAEAHWERLCGRETTKRAEAYFVRPDRELCRRLDEPQYVEERRPEPDED